MKAFCVKADNAALIAAGEKRAESRKYRVKAGTYALICTHNKPNQYASDEYEKRDPGRKLRGSIKVPTCNSVFAIADLDEAMPYDDFVKSYPDDAYWAMRGTAAGCPKVWKAGGNFVNPIRNVKILTGKPVIVKGKMGVFNLDSTDEARVRSSSSRKVKPTARGRSVIKKPAKKTSSR
eukprot:TRINITY_DN47171_c0_g1_i1.p1 TRINITY_DN47171_c0_g1~~TRINITY_DN47171_c0_g1_i1.p1  ORF type:complete len:190 (-),score=20.40 TRINITY_DN47171_c0_g1_i1:162-695(-)